ncbi:MAG: sodium/solute symporter [Ignavibacteriales bacterium]|nr:sodium/solute symporter [Ignavibacteriales bacterium]
MGFSVIDYVVVGTYIAGVVAFGIWRGGKQQTVQDYFLGKETIPWWVVCFSIVAAETSALTVISIPGVAYLTNLNFIQLTVGYLLGRIAVSFLLLPSYYKGELSTAYAFLESRFGVKTRRFASIVFMFTRVAADGVRLFATAIPLKLVLDVDYPTAILILALVALAYTYVGGVRGIVWVDALQMVIYLGGAITAALVMIFSHPEGWSGITQAASTAGKFSAFNLSFESFFQQPYTLLAGLLGGGFLSMASHGTDQLIVQRLLTVKSLAQGQKALIGSGVIIIFQFAIFLTVGLLLYGHYGGASVSDLGLNRADEIFPKFIIEGLPQGLSGLIIAGLLAAALSTLSGSMSSMSSSLVLDLYRPIFGAHLSDERALKVSRYFTMMFCGILVASAFFFMASGQAVVELALSIASFTYGGLLGTFLLGVLFKKPTQEDALGGFVAGILVMVTVITLKLVAWTWFTMTGVIATLLVGGLLSSLSRRNTSSY